MDTIRRNRIQPRNFFIRFKECVHFLYKKLILPKSASEDERRKEFILNTLLSGSIVVIFLLDIFLIRQWYIMGAEYKGIPPLIFTGILGFYCLLLRTSRVGYVKTASGIMVGAYLLGATYGIVHWGVDLPNAILAYAFTIVMASVLLGTKAGFILTALIGLVTIIISRLHLSGTIVPLTYWKLEPESRQPFQFAILYFLIMIVSWLSNREIEKSLKRARKSEEDLRKERDSLEVKVEERTRELRQSQSEKLSHLYRFAEFGKLSSGIFHDLLNPLSAVSLNVNRVQDFNSDIPSIKAHVERAIQASRRMERYIGAVRKQISVHEFQKEFCLNEEIEDSLTLLTHRASRNSVHITFVADTAITTYGNPLKFQQIIMNLIGNALDSYENLREERVDRPIKISLNEKNGSIRLEVEDKGSGILPEYIAKIFDPFFTTKIDHKGMGLGLSTTKEIIEKDFGGGIFVKSAFGQGTTFIVSFPHKTHESGAPQAG